ncbi:hypothetical protein QX776_09820 [Alteromonadaceae bacterium BrNp21-10]|nr:hypothetical protein [Alteromonadaceae bacterium BrNp21-10]
MKYWLLSPLLLLSTFLFSPLLSAEAFIPSADYVVAKSNSKTLAELTTEELTALVLDSQFVGKTEINQGLLKSQLSAKYSKTQSPNMGYLYAWVLQREHKFDQALTIISEVLSTQSNHVNARLLKANMLMVKGQFDQAKQQCLALIGHASIVTISTCSLDVQSQAGQLAQSYQGLLKITQRRQPNQATRHVLAEMALRLGEPAKSLAHLTGIELTKAPVSLVVLWADAQLALGHYAIVTTTLGAMILESNNLEDALLLKLAQAEKLDINSHSNHWQTLIAQRVQLRELRQDTFHASDLAWYYLTIENNSNKARYWANINWQQAKLQSDEILLKRANNSSLELTQ